MSKNVLFAIIFAILVVLLAGGFAYYHLKPSEEAALSNVEANKEQLKVYNSPEDKAKIQRMLKNDMFAAPKTAIIFKTIKVDGALSAVDSDRSYLFQQASIRGCYLNALSDDIKLSGLIHLKFEADASGKVIRASQDSTIAHEGLKACLQGVLDKWVFASSSDGQGMKIEASLDLSASDPPTPEELRAPKGVDPHHGHDH